MHRSPGAAGAPRTWLLAVLFVVLIDRAVTGSSVLWGKTSFEDSRDLRRIVFAQTYQVARKLYAPATSAPAPRRVALLGNSRVWLAARESFVQPELDRAAPAGGLRLANLAIFGAGLGDLEVVSRHLARLDPALVVLTIGTSDLIDTPSSPIAGAASELLRIGWRDGPLPARGLPARLDRWGRTVWPLYRFREFARAAIDDRFVPVADAEPFPEHFADTSALFAYMHGTKAAAVERAYRAWRAAPTLASFVAYLEVGSAGHLEVVRGRVREGAGLAANQPALRVLDALLARLGEGRAAGLVLVMPENPLLAEDVRAEYHRPGFSDEAVAAIGAAAARHRVPVVDARRWMPAEAFVDFDHLMPELSGFQARLATEIARAVAR